jgi:hypothetical protein
MPAYVWLARRRNYYLRPRAGEPPYAARPMDTIARLKAEQTRLIAAEAEAARHARWLAAELDAVTNELMRLDADTRAQHRAASARAIVNAGRKARNKPPLDEDGKVIPFNKDR